MSCWWARTRLSIGNPEAAKGYEHVIFVPLLKCREASEHRYLHEVVHHRYAKRTAWFAWQAEKPVGEEALARLGSSSLAAPLA